TVQMPLNVMDAHFRSFGQMVLPKLVEQNIGVLGMKSMGDQIILKSGVVTPQECLRFALTLPTSVVITGIDSMKILQQDFDIIKNFRPLSKKSKPLCWPRQSLWLRRVSMSCLRRPSTSIPPQPIPNGWVGRFLT